MTMIRFVSEDGEGEHEGEMYVAFEAGFVDDFVDGVGANAGFEGGGCNVEDFAGEATDLAHAFSLFLVE